MRAAGPSQLLLGATAVVALATFLQPVGDPDFWWHVSVGRWIVEHGRLPAHDLFTYTVPGHHRVDGEYLTEVLLWLVYSRFGLLGVSLALGAVTWLGFLLVWAAIPPADRRPYVITGLGLLLALQAGAAVWGPRTQMVTFALAGLELLWLRRYLDGSSRAILLLPVLMVLWANLHGAWPVGFVFLGVAVFAETARWLADRSQREPLTRARQLALIAVLAAAAIVVNPYGPAIYAYPIQTLGGASQQGLISEWLSPDFHQPTMRAFEVMILLLLAGFALSRPSLYDLLLCLVVLVMALSALRHVALFIAAATPVLVACWSRAWRGLAIRGWAERWFSRTARGSPLQGVLTAVALVGIGLTAAVTTAGRLAGQAEVVRQSFPVGAGDWLAAHPGVGTRMYNQYGWGGYLLNRFYPAPNRRVFIFGEADLMGDDQLRRYVEVQTVGPGWREVLADAGVDYVVFPAGSALDTLLATQPDWRPAYRDGLAVIYVRS